MAGRRLGGNLVRFAYWAIVLERMDGINSFAQDAWLMTRCLRNLFGWCGSNGELNMIERRLKSKTPFYKRQKGNILYINHLYYTA